MSIPVIPAAQVARLGRAIPFWLSLGILPLVVLAAIQGGWTALDYAIQRGHRST